MKTLVLPALVLPLFGIAGTAHAQSSVTLYGIVDTAITYVHGSNGSNNNTWAMNSGNLQGSRWGLKGAEDLGGGLQAIFRLENGFNSNDGTLGQGGRMFGRQAYVGLQSDRYGTLTLGRQYDPLVDLVQAFTADNYLGSLAATPGDVDNNDNSLRVNNAVKYTSPVFAGLQFEGMYALGGIAGSYGAGQTWSAAVAYNHGPIGIAGGYFYTSNLYGAARGASWGGTSDALFDGPINNGYLNAKAIGIGQVAGQYALGPVTLGLGYSNAQYKRDSFSSFAQTETFNTGRAFAAYQATPAWLFGIAYSYTKASGDTDAKYHQVSAGADYALSKRTDVYLIGTYQHASGTQRLANGATQSAQASIGSYGIAGTRSQEIVALGLRHKF